MVELLHQVEIAFEKTRRVKSCFSLLSLKKPLFIFPDQQRGKSSISLLLLSCPMRLPGNSGHFRTGTFFASWREKFNSNLIQTHCWVGICARYPVANNRSDINSHTPLACLMVCLTNGFEATQLHLSQIMISAILARTKTKRSRCFLRAHEDHRVQINSAPCLRSRPLCIHYESRLLPFEKRHPPLARDLTYSIRERS
jgi:hypothetical protein